METYIPLEGTSGRLTKLKPGEVKTYTVVRWNRNQPYGNRGAKAHTVLLRASNGDLTVWSADTSKPDGMAGWQRLLMAMQVEQNKLAVPEVLSEACRHGRIRVSLACTPIQGSAYAHFDWAPISGWPTPLATAPASKAGKAGKKPAIIGDILTMFGED
jgi:hypothetical protein